MKIEQIGYTYHAICASQYQDHESPQVPTRITAFSAGNPQEISPGKSKVQSCETTGMRFACDGRCLVAINTLTLSLGSTIALMSFRVPTFFEFSVECNLVNGHSDVNIINYFLLLTNCLR